MALSLHLSTLPLIAAASSDHHRLRFLILVGFDGLNWPHRDALKWPHPRTRCTCLVF